MIQNVLARLCVLLSLALFCSLAPAQSLLTSATATGAGTANQLNKNSKTFQASGATASGAGSATIAIEGSNDGSSWDVIGTIVLTLATTSSSNSFTSHDRYNRHRANVTAISGTGASVSVTAGF